MSTEYEHSVGPIAITGRHAARAASHLNAEGDADALRPDKESSSAETTP